MQEIWEQIGWRIDEFNQLQWSNRQVVVSILAEETGDSGKQIHRINGDEVEKLR